MAKSGPLSAFINKVLWAQTYPFVYVLSMAVCTTYGSWDRDHMAHTKPKIFIIWAFTEKVC